MKNKTKVLVAMSGGVDSSIAALLMKQKKYDVIGAFMKNWSDTKNKITGECAWKEERRIAIKIASQLNIPFITLDFENKYKKDVVDKMFQNYKKGITPNPDIDCNNKVKFPLLIKAAKKLKCDYVVTGHYARIQKNKQNQYELLRAKDESKDQSYFLYRLSQKDLKYSMFPIGEYTKKQIRELAKKHKFPNYNKKSTVGICFIGKINLKEFLQKKIKPKKGKILDPDKKLIGQHDGIYYYTIGQRIGPRFGIEIQKPLGQNVKKWYVAKKNPKTNIIIAAPEGHKLNLRQNIIINKFHLIDINKNQFLQKTQKPIRVYSRIRQVGELIPSKLQYNNKLKKYTIQLNKPITGISQGQAIVLYQKDKTIGGGEIEFKD